MSEDKTQIGVQEKVKFVSTGKVVDAKVDTGAEMSSMHVASFDIQGERVIFSSPVIGDEDKKYAIGLARKVRVQNSDGEVEERPVIKLDISVGGKVINGVEFSLNDRSKNQSLVLIGLNALEAGHFTVDPSKAISAEDQSEDEAKPEPAERPDVAEAEEIDVSISPDGAISAIAPTGGATEPVIPPVDAMSMNLPAEDPVDEVIKVMREKQVRLWQVAQRLDLGDEHPDADRIGTFQA